MSKSTHATKWLSVVLAILVAAVAAFAITAGAQRAEAANQTVTSWSALKSAVDDASDGDVITLGNNLVVDNNNPITVTKAVTIDGTATIFQGGPDAEGKYQTMFTVVDGGNLTIDTGVTLSGKKSTNGTSGTCPEGGTYTADTFTGALSEDGTTYDPKGFFIQVDEGTATLKGTISDFVTSRDKATTPRYVAPVVANGSNATFNLDGGTIKNNLVGYIVNDSIADKDAQSIKRYVKGAGPNVPRVPNAATQKANAESFDRTRTRDAEIDQGVPGTGITATAGAVIYKGGAQGNIEGFITNNRADTGGIMVSGEGTQVNVNAGTQISKNVGVQFGGGSTAEQGGTIAMSGGEMFENVAWFGGGAVYATENGVAWLLGLMNGDDGLHPQFDDRLDGAFVMNGGELHDNTSLTRGGAILADSDGVQVAKGKLYNNMSRMLGGAVYVMGDHPLYTYTMHLTGLYVHDNTAVSGVVPGDKATENDKLQTQLARPSACGDAPASLFSGRLAGNTDDMNDGWGTHGTGGGVWLCAYGNTVFDAGPDGKVVIADNYATGTAPLDNGVYSNWIRNNSEAQKIRDDINYNSAASTVTNTGKTGGNDIHADTGDSGTVIIQGLSTYAGWKNENTNSDYETEVSDGRINLINNGEARTMDNPAVEIYGNIARRGGGLAADGTFLLGPVGDQASVEAAMGVQKEWSPSAQKQPVTIHVEATNGTKTAFVADVPLDGVANAPITEFDTVQELAPTNNTWNGQFKLPLELTATDGSKIPVFKVTIADTRYLNEGEDTDANPLSYAGRNRLAKVIKKIKAENTTDGVVNTEAVLAKLKTAVKVEFADNLTFKCDEYEMVYDAETEAWTVKTDGGNPVKLTSYVFTPEQVNLDQIEYTLTSTSHYEKVINEETHELEDKEIFQVHLFGVNLVLPMSNDNHPIAEKYVNQEVHSDIINFDQEFTYDIMAYVPKTAESFTITDTLVKGLEFANSNGGASTTPGDVVQSIAVKTTNNHQPGSNDGSVASPGEPDYNGKTINMKPGNSAKISDTTTVTFGTTVDISGNTLTVRIADEPTLNVVRGKWVQVTFNARIKDQYRNLDALKALQAEVTGKDKSWEGTATNKQGADTEVYTTANGDLSLVAELKNKVGPDEVIWAVEAPSRLFARTASGDYYATDFNDKNGDAWQILDKTTDDDQGDKGYGKSVWENADNRYNGRAPHANNTVDQIALDDAKLNTLKAKPKVVGSEVTKAAEGINRLFAEVVDAEDNTHIYACDNKQTGTGWYEIPSSDTAEYNNALARLANDRYTIRMLDLETQSITLDPKETANWPVISNEKHEGMANQAKYNVTFPGDATSNHTTNTVTVSPETAELDVAKVWSTDGANSWPEGVGSVSFNVYAVSRNNSLYQVYVGTEGVNRGKVVGMALVGNPGPANSEPLTVTLTKDKRSATVEGLPRMKSFIYWAREASISDTDGNQTQLSYTGNTMNDTVKQKSTVGSLDVFTTMATSYKGDGAKFESLRTQVDKKVVRGAIADNRLWGMTLDGSYFTTAVGDTAGTGENAWTQLEEPSATDQDFMDKMLLVKRANELLGTINKSTGYMTNGTATGDGITIIDIVNVATATNATATEEKYIENAVHAEIVNFDEVFTYSVMGYVPANATKAVISDTLTKDLVLLNRDGGEELNKSNVLVSVQAYKTNDHKGNGEGTVSTSSGDNFLRSANKVADNTRQQDKAEADRDYSIELLDGNKTIKLTLLEGFLNEVRNDTTTPAMVNAEDKGFWVKISFKAKINPESYAALQQKIASGDDATVKEEGGLTWKKVDADAPVTDGAAAQFGDKEEPYRDLEGAHAGLLNKANYTVEFGNSGTYTHDTNEVTVKPDTVDLAFQKNWSGVPGDWPEGVDTVTVGVFAQSTDGDETKLTEVLGTLEAVEGYPLQANYVMPAAGAQDAKQATWELTAEKKSATVVGLPRLDGVSYFARELSIDGTAVENGKTSGVASIDDHASFIASYNDIAYSKLLDKTQTIITNERVEVEKYVNNDVHADLVEFDKVFKYDIMAYVGKDATEAIITDALVPSLEFAKAPASSEDIATVSAVASNNPDEVVTAVVAKAMNDHKAGGTVAGSDEEENPATNVRELARVNIDKDTQTLTVSFVDNPETEDVNEIADVQGQWVQVTFWAKYTDATIAAAQIGDVATVTNNGAVISEAYPNVAEDAAEGAFSHAGTLNNATYTLKVGNDAQVDLKTNTVTVDAETTKLSAAKVWSEGTWPEGAVVTFDIVAVKDGQATPVIGKLEPTSDQGEELDNDKIEELDAPIGSSEPAAEPAVAADPVTYLYIGEGEQPITVKLDGDPDTFVIEGLPKLIGTTYQAVETAVNGAPVKEGVAATDEFANYFATHTNIPSIMIPGGGETGDTTIVENELVQTEKYVNNDVHADLVEFDKVFKYDILTYVSNDATQVTITDPLPGALEFAKKTGGNLQVKAEAATTADETIEAIVAKDANDHTVGSTVAGADEDNAGEPVKPTSVSIKNNTLTVAFGTEEEPVTDATGIRGKWVQITFYAKYTDKVIEAAQIGDTATVKSNGAVLGGVTPHDGTANQAQVSMTVENGAKADLKTNTVTVKPETTSVTVSKTWLAGDTQAAWPAGAEVEVLVKNGTETVATDVLTADKPSVTFDGLPRLVDVEYTVEEGKATAGHYELGAVEQVEPGVFAITNSYVPDKPEIEKYVNNDVHADLVEFDKVFKYDILAYVTDDAKTVSITDALVPSIEFADGTLGEGVAAVACTDPAKVVTAIQAKGAINNHVAGAAGTVAQAGTDISEFAKVELLAEGRTLQVTFDDAEAAGIRGQWVQVTFWAKYTDSVIDAVKIGDVATVEDNGVIITAFPTHDGTTNDASYKITADNGYKYEEDTNTVTVKPESCTVSASKKWLDHTGAAMSDWPANVQSVVIDVLGKDGVIVDSFTLTAAEPSKTSSELPKLVGVEYTLQEAGINYLVEPKQEEEFFLAGVEEGNVFVNQAAPLTNVSITKVWAGARADEIMGTEEFKSALRLACDGEDVTSLYADKLSVVDNGDFTYTATWSNLPAAAGEFAVSELPVPGYTTTVEGATFTNTKVREEKPEIEKFVNQAVHKDIQIADTFTYDIVAYVTPDADTVTITDTLDDTLAFAGGPESVRVVDLGAANNHKPTFDVSATQVSDDATVAATDAAPVEGAQCGIVDKTLVVSIANKMEDVLDEEDNVVGTKNADDGQYVSPLRGHWVRVTFDAKVDGKTLEQLKAAYVDIDPTAAEDRAADNEGNAPVLSTQGHTGVPNKASYEIGVGNSASVYGDTSNTVTVRPQESFDVLISKTDLGGTELEGATIKVTGPDGFSDEWVSGTQPHQMKLAPGEYAMVEVVAPTGYQQVTTQIKFAVADDGTVSVLNAQEVDGGGNVKVMEGEHIVLADAPIPTFDITISKTDLGGTEVAGAKMELRDEEGNVIDSWTSTTTEHKVTLKPGRYVLKEQVAPEGFDLVTTDMVFVVDQNGNVKLETTEVNNGGAISAEGGHIDLADAPTRYLTAAAATIHKAWDDAGNAVARGAVTFQAEYSVDGGSTWTPMPGKTIVVSEPQAAGGTDGLWMATFENLPALINGIEVVWRAVEVLSVEGYGNAVAQGTTDGFMAINTVNDNKRGVLISKQAVGGGPELPGAKIQIIDANGNVVEEWISGEEPHLIRLDDGEYTLREITAPDGYEIAEDMRFKVENGITYLLQNGEWVDVADHVVMFDAPTTTVEDKPKNPNPTIEEEETPAKTNPSTPSRVTAATPSSATAKTSDDVAGLAVACTMLLLAGAGALALARRRLS